MGKNTMMKRSIRLWCETTGNDAPAALLDELVGNVGLVFTKGDLKDVQVCAWRFIRFEAYPSQGHLLKVASTQRYACRCCVGRCRCRFCSLCAHSRSLAWICGSFTKLGLLLVRVHFT
jgi:hypothetical protein